MDLRSARHHLPARGATSAALVFLVLMWLAQVATPLFERGQRQAPTTAVVVLLAASALCAAAASVGWWRALVAVTAATAVGFAVEAVGTRTGLPFGEYRYSGALQPQVLGVPVVVALAWAGMGLPAWAVAGRLVHQPAARVALGAAALTGWDLFLDPQMVAEGFWIWPGGGAYRGIPLSNFAGWLAVSALLMALFALVAPGARSKLAASTYALMAVMEVLGFLLFFGDAVVAIVGGLVCVPLGVAALVAPRPPGRLEPEGRRRRPLAARG
ncbi:MAG: Carotenoid biosynthesis protein [uncultured Acidimicrobiales bacterium]|uniref:Carotenoid biosynthesis protein n=1 Tax=uncultured Acidimicrobiales bacterium TaxID=310071 RepID=A0A6J4HWB7_9ACTN|nr:MAG: Carotenoid biosynthesis protein [uncultured Acidimicrobiales bacterium]